MSASALAKTIRDKLNAIPPSSYSSSTPATMGSIFCTELTTYLLANCKLMGSYTGTIPGTPPVPEAAPTDAWTVVGTVAPCTPSSAGFDAWMTMIENAIRVGIMTGLGVSHPITPVPAFPGVSLATFINQSMLKSIVDGAPNDTSLQCHTTIIQGIFNALMAPGAYVPTVPAGIAGVGVFTSASVIIT